MSVAYSRAYIPSRGSGSGCGIKEEATFDLATALDVLNEPLPKWCKSYGVYPEQYKDIDRWYNSDNYNKKNMALPYLIFKLILFWNSWTNKYTRRYMNISISIISR